MSEDDELRALLREARADEPVPPEVVARLDATLASLRADEPVARVVPVRRRWVPRASSLAAAAVVLVVGGVGITQVVSSTGGGDDSVTSAESADAGGAAAEDNAGGTDVQPSQPEAELRDRDVPEAVAGAAGDLASRLSTPTFARDTAALMRTLAATTTSESGRAAPPVTDVPTPLRSAQAYADACRGPSVTDAVVLAASLDDRPVVLVFRAPTEAGQLVEAWSCDGSTVLASATVPR